MADVTISATAAGGTSRLQRALIYTSTSVGYAFFIGSSGELFYRKTSDGGASWGSDVTVRSADGLIAACCWFDKWTSGDSGTLIHVAYFGGTADDVLYRSLDTSSDTLGTERTLHAGTTAVADAGAHVSITKAARAFKG